MNTDSDKSPAARVMNEAIESAIEERSPYPERLPSWTQTSPPWAPRSVGQPTKAAP